MVCPGTFSKCSSSSGTLLTGAPEADNEKKTPSLTSLPTSTAQPTLEESLSRTAKYAPSSKQAKELNQAVAYFIAKDMLPFQAVEKPGFLHLMKKVAPQYKVPVRTHFSTNEIPKLYMEVRASIEEQIKEAEWFGATTDVWTSSGGSVQVHQLLQPLNELTDVMASEKQVTLSSLKPVLEHINKRILNEKEGDSALTKQMKKAGNFSEKLEDTVKACTQEAISLAPTPIPDEPAQPQATILRHEQEKGQAALHQHFPKVQLYLDFCSKLHKPAHQLLPPSHQKKRQSQR
ncbi:hypothetical protein WMY93_000114 [Mugilogobius chulae]|uniref:Uncharacterized protein n=1 Tax=Mugilogobius chulae TaxID=88201 RepID=A0AAW0PXZ7_9GOBI